MLTRIFRRLGRTLEPLFAPDAAARRERDARLLELLREQRSALKGLGDQTVTQIRHSGETRRDDMVEVRQRLLDLRGEVRRHASSLGRLARRTGLDAELEWSRQRVVQRLERIARSSAPVIVGPWTGEVGFELLYWVPFVRWAVEKFGIAPERIVIVSRGGTAAWYEGIGHHYVDAFSYVTPDQFREGTEVKKQRSVRAFDRRLLKRISSGLGERTDLLHPALMYAVLMPYWKRKASFAMLLEHARFRRISPQPPQRPLNLPERYIAVRFYFSNCFPDTPENRAIVAQTIRGLAESIDVVLLNTGLRIDDHAEFVPAPSGRIHMVSDAMTPDDNLAVQTAIIAGAQAFVGTYGGFSYLPVLCGVDSFAFYSERNYFLHHLELIEHVTDEVNGGRLLAIDVRHQHHLQAMFNVSSPAAVGHAKS